MIYVNNEEVVCIELYLQVREHIMIGLRDAYVHLYLF